MIRDQRQWWFVPFAFLTFGCGPAAPEAPTIRVAAASDLEQAMPILAMAFRQEHEIEIVPTFGPSGTLAEQIRQGAPFDVFLSADKGFVDRLAAEGQIKAESVRPYFRGTLVLAVNKLSALKLRGLEDLTRPEVQKIAIANPESAPFGKAAKQALEHAKLWDLLKPKIVPADSVRQALQFVQTGNAEVALVSRSISDVREVVIVPLPVDVCDPIIQYLGVVAKTNRPEDARAFANFVLGDVGQGILRDIGFRRVRVDVKSEATDEPKGAK